jgi:CheY-like chemotaxis protein
VSETILHLADGESAVPRVRPDDPPPMLSLMATAVHTPELSWAPSETAVRVLVVDDDEAVRTVLSHVLADEGFEVVGVAADGAEAVTLTQALNPDTIVLDVRMPGVGGIEAARRIRPISPDARIVMLSAYDDPTLQSEATEAGANRFLIKGCALTELVDAIAG